MTRRDFACSALLAAAKDAPQESLALSVRGRRIAVHQCGAGLLKPYVHPLYAPDGSVITLDAPHDHLHHHGLMIGWSEVNGYDFWSEAPPERCGRMRQTRLDQRAPDRLTATLEWTAGGTVLAVERRRLRAAALRDGSLLLDWTSEITAGRAPVELKAHKLGFDGLGVRVVRSMDGGGTVNSNGTRDFTKASGEPAEWCAYHATLPGGGPGGVAILGHPGNPRHPAPFFVMNQKFGYLSAAPTFRAPFAVSAGQTLRLRYGVLTFAGEAAVERLDKLHQEWLQKEEGLL